MPENQLLVSVIIPCYNYGQFLRLALDSLQAQSLTEWECLIVDDGSTDSTCAVAGEYATCDSRIGYVFQTNAGHSAARNTGLRQARGRYIQFLDADDVIQKFKLQSQVKYLDATPECDVVYGNHDYFTDDTLRHALDSPFIPDSSRGDEAPGPVPDILLRLLDHNVMVTHAPLFRRGLFEDVGPLDTTLAAAEDWDFWLRCAFAGAMFHRQNWDYSAALVRHHADSYSHDRRRMLESILKLRAKIGQFTSDPALCEINRRKSWEEEAALGKYEEVYGNWWRGVSLLGRAGLQAHSPKWLAYALLLPLLRPSLLRRIPRVRQALRSFE